MIRTLEQVIASTKELLIDKFPEKKEYADEIIDVILARELLKFRIELSTKSFLQLYQEYCLPTETLECEDVTKSEVETLIYEAKLSERDNKIAKLYFVDHKSEDNIAQELMVDKKTIHSNLPKISHRLKRTAIQLYRSHTK